MRPNLGRIIASLLVLLVLIQVLTNAWNSHNIAQDEIAASDETPEITIWYTDSKLNDYVTQAAEEYQEQKGVIVNCQLISAVDYIERISDATLIEEDGPDLFVASSDMLQKALYAGIVSDDVSYKPQELENIPQKALDAATCNNTLIGYPFYFESCFLLYNQYYTENWPITIDEILDYADNYEQTDTTARVENIFKWDVSDIFYNYFFVGGYTQLGGIYGDDVSQLSFSQDKAVECLNYYQSLNSFFAIDANTVHSEDIIQEFIDGKIVFTIAKTDAIARLDQAIAEGNVPEYTLESTKDEEGNEIPPRQVDCFYGVGDIPNLTDELYTVGLSVTNAVIVNNYTEYPAISADFAHYLTYDKAGELYNSTGKVSICKNVTKGNENWERIMGQYEGSTETSKIIEMSNYCILMEIAFANVWNGADPAEQLKNVGDQMKMQIKQSEIVNPENIQ